MSIGSRKENGEVTCGDSGAHRTRVFYFVDLDSSEIAYQEEHVMRPLRVRLTHSLIYSLGLNKRVTKICRPLPASAEEMCVFHREAYLECLRSAPRWCGHPLSMESLAVQKEFDVPVGSRESDCPLFPQVWDLASSQAGGSLACATALNTGMADVAIHWGGGMHHAAAAHASGFCFVNDIVLCIRRLLQSFMRVLYVDLDVHHGDGVEAAFIGNPRVMTLSLHQFGDKFFPGTGDYVVEPEPVNHVGRQRGDGLALGGADELPEGTNASRRAVASADLAGGMEKSQDPPAARGSHGVGPFVSSGAAPSYAVNVPLPARSGDAAYLLSFRTAFDAILPVFDPDAIVVQCGADTISGDPIGRLCVTTQAHVACVRHILTAHQRQQQQDAPRTHRKRSTEREDKPMTHRRRIPTVLLGGGGYHVLHTAQCWALHTATAVGLTASELPLYVPRHDPYYMDYRQQQHGTSAFGNRPTLHVQLDPDVDHPLPLEISLVYFHQLCRTLPWQLKAIRRLRQGFDRVVHQRIGSNLVGCFPLECSRVGAESKRYKTEAKENEKSPPTKQRSDGEKKRNNNNNNKNQQRQK